jgi:dTDP-glucose pyrophosphorylase
MTDSNKPALVILAAGIGQRYGGPKQIDSMGPSGERIIDYSIFDALLAGFGKVVFVISHSMEDAFRASVGNRIAKRCEVAYVFQDLEDLPPGFSPPAGRIKPWGTAHATLSCRQAIDGPFAVINADDFYGRSAYQALFQHLERAHLAGKGPEYCLVGYRLADTLSPHGHVARGVCTVNERGYLVQINERTRIEKRGGMAQYMVDGQTWIEIPPEATVSMNIWGFLPSLFSELEAAFVQFLRNNVGRLTEAEFYLPEVIGNLITEGKARVKVLPAGDQWFGVTYPQDKVNVKASIHSLVRQGVYPRDLWADSPSVQTLHPAG